VKPIDADSILNSLNTTDRSELGGNGSRRN